MARRPRAVNPMRPSFRGDAPASNPESRDSGSGPSDHPGMTLPSPLRPQRDDGEVAGAEVVGTEVGQLAFQAFDVQPQRLAMAEQQKRAATGGFARMEFDPDQFQHRLRLRQIDVARLAGQDAVEA